MLQKTSHTLRIRGSRIDGANEARMKALTRSRGDPPPRAASRYRDSCS
jgi:hypothetical protein